MQRKHKAALARPGLLYRIFLLLAVTSLLFFGTSLTSRSAVQAAAPEPMDPRVLADTNKPGVVMIATLYKANISVPDVILSQDAIRGLQNKLLDEIANGQVANNPTAIIDAMLKELFANPLLYLVPTDNFTSSEVQTGSIGTGFILTPDGYVLTNAHVVYTPEDQLKAALVNTGLKELIEKDVSDFLQEVKAQNYKPSDEILNGLRKAAATFYIKYATLSNVQTQIFTEMGVAIPGIQVMQKGFASELKGRGEPSPGKDVAILKIDKNNLPTVPIGDDTKLRTGDKIFVVGYPGAATFNPMLANESVVESTLTSGLISARKTMPGGWDILQVDAAMTHGNSGGPVFNENGEVIGIATFGSVSESSDTEVQGMNFVVPISIAKQFLNERNVTPSESQLTKIYKEGLAYYNKQKFSKALDKFREVNELNPGYPYIQTFITESRQAIGTDRDQSGSSTLTYVYWGAGILLALVLLGLLFRLILKLRKYSFVMQKKPEAPGPGLPATPPPSPQEPAAPVPPLAVEPASAPPPAQEPSVPAPPSASSAPSAPSASPQEAAGPEDPGSSGTSKDGHG